MRKQLKINDTFILKSCVDKNILSSCLGKENCWNQRYGIVTFVLPDCISYSTTWFMLVFNHVNQ